MTLTQARDPLLGAAALFAGAAVGLGAYGAHGLSVDDTLVRIWETGVQYQMWHALGAVVAVILGDRWEGRRRSLARLAGWGMLAGTVLFSGTLYWFVLDGIIPVPGAAPIGGISLMAAWALLAAAAVIKGR